MIFRQEKECLLGIWGNLGAKEQGIIILSTSSHAKKKSCIAVGGRNLRVGKIVHGAQLNGQSTWFH